VADEPLRLNLAPAQLLLRHAEFRWRRGLNLAAATIAAAGLALTATYWLHARDLRDQARQMQAETQRTDARHAAIVRNFPALATRPDQLGQILALARQLDRVPLDVEALLSPLGQALARHPEVVVNALTLQETSAGTAEITLDARLAEFDGNYRAAMARIDSLVARLAATPGVTAVERVASPVDTAPSATLTGTTGGERAPEDTHFSLRLRVRP
jgi:NAD(P)H-dependent flavin oxidoreductase YrpB (nitropropane dioxygenase family)